MSETPAIEIAPGKIELALGDDHKVQIRYFVRRDKNTFVQGVIGPDIAAKIKTALAPLLVPKV
jgi:hypothetical protein